MRPKGSRRRRFLDRPIQPVVQAFEKAITAVAERQQAIARRSQMPGGRERAHRSLERRRCDQVHVALPRESARRRYGVGSAPVLPHWPAPEPGGRANGPCWIAGRNVYTLAGVCTAEKSFENSVVVVPVQRPVAPVKGLHGNAPSLAGVSA